MKGYPSKFPARARELHEAGWESHTEIARIIGREFGRQPSRDSVARWIDPDYAEVTRMRQRRGGTCGPRRCNTWRLRLQRMRDLRGAGLSCSAIAKVMALDFDLSLSVAQVEDFLSGKTSERTIASALQIQGASSR